MPILAISESNSVEPQGRRSARMPLRRYSLRNRWSTGAVVLGWLLLFANPPGFILTAVSECHAPRQMELSISLHPSAASFEVLGAWFGERGDYACAVPNLLKAEKLDPDFWAPHFSLALIFMASRKFPAAIEQLRVAERLKPDDPRAHSLLGVALSHVDETDAAIDELQQSLMLDPSSIDSIDWLAKALISEHRYNAAIVLLENAPTDVKLQMDLAIAYSQAGNNGEAIKVFSRMIQRLPSYSPAYSGLATIYTQQLRYQDAAVELRKAISLDRSNSALLLSYVRILIVLGEYDTAFPIIDGYEKVHPRSFDATYLDGIVTRNLGQLNNARRLLAQAVSLNPHHYDSQYNLGLVLFKLKLPMEASAHFKAAVLLSPDESEAHFQLANTLRLLGKTSEATKQFGIYKQLIEQKSRQDIATSEANQAKALIQSGNARGAVELYVRALAETPNDAHLNFQLAVARDRIGDYDGEVKDLQKSIRLQPGFADAYNQLGAVALQRGQSQRAKALFEKALSLDPHNAHAQNNLGIFYGDMSDDHTAEQLFRRAIENDPLYVQAMINLSATLASESKFSEATETIACALRSDPENEQAKTLERAIEERARAAP